MKLNIVAGRTEIREKIDTVQVRIEEVNSSLKGEIKRVEADISNKLEPIIVTSRKHSDASENWNLQLQRSARQFKELRRNWTVFLGNWPK